MKIMTRPRIQSIEATRRDIRLSMIGLAGFVSVGSAALRGSSDIQVSPGDSNLSSRAIAERIGSSLYTQLSMTGVEITWKQAEKHKPLR